MKHMALALALAAGLMASPVAAVAQDPVPAADRSDMECAALFAVMAGADPEYEAFGAMGMAYYIGRLEGRSPGQNQVKRLSDWVNSQSEEDLLMRLDEAAQRCGTEMQILGNSLIAIGDGNGG